MQAIYKYFGHRLYILGQTHVSRVSVCGNWLGAQAHANASARNSLRGCAGSWYRWFFGVLNDDAAGSALFCHKIRRKLRVTRECSGLQCGRRFRATFAETAAERGAAAAAAGSDFCMRLATRLVYTFVITHCGYINRKRSVLAVRMFCFITRNVRDVLWRSVCDILAHNHMVQWVAKFNGIWIRVKTRIGIIS